MNQMNTEQMINHVKKSGKSRLNKTASEEQSKL